MRFLLILLAALISAWGQTDQSPTRLDAVPSTMGAFAFTAPFSIAASDNGRVLLLSNATPFEVAIGAAGTGGYVAPWFVDVTCVLSACTIRPDTGTINGASSFTLAAGQQVRVSVVDSTYVTAGATPETDAWTDDGMTVSTTRNVNVGAPNPPDTIGGSIAARKLYADQAELTSASLNTMYPATPPVLSATGSTGTSWGYRVSDVLSNGRVALTAVAQLRFFARALACQHRIRIGRGLVRVVGPMKVHGRVTDRREDRPPSPQLA